jgi:glucosamine--fructose-6-phosphate aminotransferase (isomerizing)
MCGIVGYVGGQAALDVVVEGLRRLEYRGYDSAGVALVAGERLHVAKKAGKLGNLEKVLAEEPLPHSGLGIGHTRWATHGGPNDVNAHPHTSADGRIALVHNGIIENYLTLRDELQAAGISCQSETDTEIVAQLLGQQVGAGLPLEEAMGAVCRRLRGAFTLVAVDSQQPNMVVAARRNSPLVVGVGQGENFVASDVAAFIEHTREAIELGQDQLVRITPDAVEVTTFDGQPADVRPYHVDWDLSAAEKGGYDWFMRKEIYEQPRAVADTLLGRHDANDRLTLDEIRIPEDELREVDKIIVVACGTAFYAGLVAKYAIEHWTRIPCEVELASEFRYRDPIVDQRTLVVAISQSGETADTLMAIRHAREQRARVLAICNTNGSTQLVACYLLGLYLAQVRGARQCDEISETLRELAAMPGAIQHVLEDMDPVMELAAEFARNRSVLFIGRHVGYPVALEGALKLKELAYIHAEGFAAGELKHGPIALIENQLPVFVVVPSSGDVLHDKVLSNLQEVRARGAKTIVLAEDGDDVVGRYADVIIKLPKVSALLQPLVATVPLQVFACELATQKGHDVDQPRNLAKSVTVE